MSERMIELQRAKLGLPPTGSPPSAAAASQTARPGGKGKSLAALNKSPSAPRVQTPQQAAAAEVLSEDAQIQRFLHRLQKRDDSHPASGSVGPTVPTALSRRLLHRQGVGYLDDTVAAAVSASADRFLATVLQQSVACRDQRLKGLAIAREAARHRKRHLQHYQADSDDRKRRKEETLDLKERAYLGAIATADNLKRSSRDTGDAKKKKKKKTDDGKPAANGVKLDAIKNLDDDEESYDSIDEEEDYYKNNLGDCKGRLQGEEEDDDDTLLLRDLVPPLEAWDVHLTGKDALEAQDSDSDEEDVVENEEEKTDANTAPTEENGEEGLSLAMMDGAKSDGKTGDETDNDAKRKSATSPVPQSS